MFGGIIFLNLNFIMYRNYFFLNRLVIELNRTISGKKLLNSFSQEKNKLLFVLENSDSPEHMEISVDNSNPYILLRKNFKRAGKNTVDFFTDLFPQKIEKVLISKFDRTILFALENSKIYFAVRGSYTNIIVLDAKGISTFKKEENGYLEAFIKEMNSTEFINSIEIPDLLNSKKIVSEDSLRKIYPVINKQLVNEAKLLSKTDDFSSLLKNLINLLTRIFSEPISIYYDDHNFSLQFGLSRMNIFSNISSRSFNTYNEALTFYLSKSYFYDKIRKKKKTIITFLEHEINKLSSKLNNLKLRLEKGNKEQEYKKIGTLLLINLNSLNHLNSKIELTDIYTDNKITVSINPKMSIQQNADLYFEKAKNESKNYFKTKQLFSQLNIKLNKYKNDLKIADETNNLTVLDEMIKEYKLTKIQNKETIVSQEKFKHYVIDNKYHVFAGKSSANNDLLTTQYAKQNDYWFHARSVSGSHVILRVENSKEHIPKDVLKKAASIAAFHSKAKTAGLVPVSYTFKKYVVKKKSMPPGTVNLLKEDVLLVRPEIPSDCEYISNE